MIRVDCHSHTLYSPDSRASLEEIIEACRRAGIGCLCVTDHNRVEGAFELLRRAPFKVVVGEEITTTRGDIIGLFLRELVPPGLTPAAAAAAVHEQGGLVCVPHPFDRFRDSRLAPSALTEIAPMVDLVEVFNARTTLGLDDARALAWARAAGKGQVVCSDAHSGSELGAAYLEMEDFEGPQAFLAALPSARPVTRRSSPLVHLQSRLARLAKRLR